MEKNKDNNIPEVSIDELSKLLNKGSEKEEEIFPDFFDDEKLVQGAPAGAADLTSNKDSNPAIKEVDSDEIPEVLKDAIKVAGKSAAKPKAEIKPEIEPDVDPDLEEPKGNIDDLGEYEEDVAKFFTEKFSEELAWEFTEEEKPKNIAEIVDYIRKVVDENSTPSYSDERVKSLDEFIANGGKFEDFYKVATNESIPLDTVDLENESHQKALLREDLKNSGYNDSVIDKKIQRWETAGVLQDEAEEAIDRVKEYRTTKQQKLLEEQRKVKQDTEKAQQLFFSSVDKITKETTNILGVDVSAKEKQTLLEYVFRPESDGYTKFFKETGLVVTPNTNPKYLLETAYIAKNGNTLVNKIEKKVESQAAKNLKEKLSYSKGPRGVNQTADRDNSYNLLNSLGSQLLPRN